MNNAEGFKPGVNVLNYAIELMAKKTSQKSAVLAESVAPTPDKPVVTRRLIVTLPILVAVVFSVTYLLTNTPSPTTTNGLTTQARHVDSSLQSSASLAVEAQSVTKLTALPVVVQDDLLLPNPNNTGDPNASAAAQPTVTPLQAPVAATPSDTDALQAHKHTESLESLLRKL